MFFKKPSQMNILLLETKDTIKKLDLYKTNGKTFRLFIDTKKSNGTIGLNDNYSLSVFGDNGFTLVADNKTLGIKEINMADDIDIIMKDIEDGFNIFKKFADNL